MAPLQALFCPVAVIGITSLYAAWHRVRLGQGLGTNRRLRERVTYMLWVTASRF
jgi:hypothetical protein